VELNRITLELLRDEAYILLCREAILARMETRNRENSSLSRAHPLPPVPAPKTRQSSPALFSENDPDIALYSRLSRIGRLESWVQQRLRGELTQHLEATNPAFQFGIRIQQALNEWEFCVRHVLPDSLAEFARELRGLRLAATDPHRPVGKTTAPEFVALRRIASRVEEQQLQVGRIASTVAGHAQQIGATNVLPPPLPNFRRIVWVDWISVAPVEHLISEVTRVEGDVRNFLNQGLAATLERMQACRNACSTRQELILSEYWKRLRDHAQSHFVEEGELDVVLDSLSLRYEAEIARREGIRSGLFVES